MPDTATSNFISTTETLTSFLFDVKISLDLISDMMSSEGYQAPEAVDELKAIIFSRRLPLYLSTISVILHDFSQILDELDEAIEETYRKD